MVRQPMGFHLRMGCMDIIEGSYIHMGYSFVAVSVNTLLVQQTKYNISLYA